MIPQSNPRIVSSLKSFSQAASVTVTLVGSLVLIGWILDIPILKSVLPDLVTMKTNTALGFILAGVSLWLLHVEKVNQRTRRVSQACAGTVTLVGLLTLSEYLFGRDLSIDQLLFQETVGAAGTSSPNRMAPNTALNFLLLGFALILLDVESRGGHRPAQFLTLPATVVALLALIGYAYSVTALYGIASYTQMALHTAVAFIVLSVGVLFSRPDRELMTIIISDSAGGALARRLLLIAISMPLLLGWLYLAGQRAGLFDTQFALSLLVVSSIVVLAVVIWWNATLLDRTDAERTRAEKTLRESNSMFLGLFESAPDAIIVVSRDGRIARVNNQTEALFGYSRGELLDQLVEVLIPERFTERHLEHRAGYISQPHMRPMGAGLELYGRRKEGSEFPVDITLGPLETDGDMVVLSIVRDITQRKGAEEQIHLNLERIRALHEIDLAITSTLDLHAILDVLLEKIDLFFPHPVITAVRLLDKETGLLEPLACRNISKEEWIAAMRTIRDDRKSLGTTVMENKAPIVISNIQTDPLARLPEFYRKHRVVSYLGIPLIVKDDVLGVLSFYTKDEHQFSNEEIEFLSTLAGQVAVAIQNSQLYEEMVRANKVKDEFLSVMSHELRTPLNVVIGYAGMMKDGLLGDINPQQEESLGKVLRGARDQLDLVNGILHATALEAQEVKVNSHEVSLEDFLNELRSAYQVPLEKGPTLKWDYSSQLPVIKTDSAKLKQILQNLINNAIKFTDKGHVTISVRLTDGRRELELKVADTGMGIPKENLSIIFEKFRQVDSSETRLHGGVGLGLYIVKKFTEMLGGTVEVESEPGKGSTFTVTIPLKPRDSKQIAGSS